MSTYILVPGLWIGAWAWHDVTAALRDAGHEVFPLTLTGVADRSHLLGPDVDLDTHIEDIVRLAEAEDLHDIVLVGHSYGGLPVSAAALRLARPDQGGGLCGQWAAAGRHGPDGHVRRQATSPATRWRHGSGIRRRIRTCWPVWTMPRSRSCERAARRTRWPRSGSA